MSIQESLDLKEKGNQEFKNKNYKQALDLYTRAISKIH
jgi:hypothetical protein